MKKSPFKKSCKYDYKNKCDCSEDDNCGCDFPNNMDRDFDSSCFDRVDDEITKEKICIEYDEANILNCRRTKILENKIEFKSMK